MRNMIPVVVAAVVVVVVVLKVIKESIKNISFMVTVKSN